MKRVHPKKLSGAEGRKRRKAQNEEYLKSSKVKSAFLKNKDPELSTPKPEEDVATQTSHNSVKISKQEDFEETQNSEINLNEIECQDVANSKENSKEDLPPDPVEQDKRSTEIIADVIHHRDLVPLCDESMSVRLRNNYLPLHFHHVHGENIKLTKNRTVACRSEGFCNGIVFSDRPVMICEPIYVKFLETSPNWSGAVRIGFTMNDPVSLKSKLPRYACPDLTSMHGNWAKAVGEKFAKKGSVLYYYVDQNGDVHYGIGNEEYGIFFGGVNTSGRLWAVLDVYGNTVAVEFIDLATLSSEYQNDSQNSALVQVRDKSKRHSSSKGKAPAFHTTHGKNVTLKKNRSVVAKKPGFHSLAYAFTESPLKVGEQLFLFVRDTDHYCEGNLVYGITSCNPADIDPHGLPENVDDLLDRSEYWIVKQKSMQFEVGDLITIFLNCEGEVEVLFNGESEPIFYVDVTQPLWLFVNLIHSVSELRIGDLAHSSPPEDECCEGFSKLHIAALCSDEKVTPGPSGQQSSNECVICYEESVDCALYRCGHMCMCYNCAFKLWKSNSSAQCPICRNSIQDVIKIYK